MRLLADENIPFLSVEALRAGGHDVLAAAEMMAGAADREVLALARVETHLQRIEGHRPLAGIDSAERRSEATEARRWFREEFLIAIPN